MSGPRVPAGLSERAGRLWKAVVVDYDLSAAELEVLRGAVECLDRADAAAKVVKREGVTTVDRYGCAKAHPALDAEMRARALFNAAVRQLGVRLVDEVSVPRAATSRRARQAANSRWSRERGGR